MVVGVEKEAGDQILIISADGHFAQNYEYTNSLTPMIELALESMLWSPIITVDPIPDNTDTTRSLVINVDVGSTVTLADQITGTLITIGKQAPPLDFILTRTTSTRYRAQVTFADTPWRQAHILVQAATSKSGILQTIATYSADDDAPGSHARAYIDASSQNGACNLHFPDNAFPVSVRPKLFNVMQWSLHTPPLPSTGGGNFTISQACYFSPSKAIAPGVKGTLVLYFDSQFLTNLDTNRLRIYRWDRDLKAGEWIPVDRINNENYYVAAPIDKSGLYVVAVASSDNMNQTLFLPLVAR